MPPPLLALALPPSPSPICYLLPLHINGRRPSSLRSLYVFTLQQPVCPKQGLKSATTTWPDTYDGYETHRERHRARIERIFTQPRKAESTYYNRRKGSELGALCYPGDYGRTNCAGWANLVSKEGIGGRPVFMRGSPFAMAHAQF